VKNLDFRYFDFTGWRGKYIGTLYHIPRISYQAPHPLGTLTYLKKRRGDLTLYRDLQNFSAKKGDGGLYGI